MVDLKEMCITAVYPSLTPWNGRRRCYTSSTCMSDPQLFFSIGDQPLYHVIDVRYVSAEVKIENGLPGPQRGCQERARRHAKNVPCEQRRHRPRREVPQDLAAQRARPGQSIHRLDSYSIVLIVVYSFFHSKISFFCPPTTNS